MTSSISATNFLQNVEPYVAKANAAYKAEQVAAKTETEAVKVSVSDHAKKAYETSKSLPDLVIELNPEVHKKNAAARLQVVMAELGIPADTQIDIKTSNSGKITVTADHPKAEELEKMLNDGTEMELRNSLIGAHTSAIIQRIGKAMEMAKNAADADPSRLNEFYQWVLSVADHAKGLSGNYTYNQGEVTGGLVRANGTALAIDEGLNLPA